MGIGGIGIWQLLIILVIVLLLFGTKKLRNLGGDLGGAIKGFKKAVGQEKSEQAAETEEIGSDAQAKKASAKAEKSADATGTQDATAGPGNGKSS